MMIFPLNTLQFVLTTILYIALFVQGYLLIKFIRQHVLLHSAVVGKLKVLTVIFAVLLVVKLSFSIMAIKAVDIARIAQ